MTTPKKTAAPRKKSLKKPPTEKNKVGRPPLYSLKLAQKICGLIATNPASLKSICQSNPDLPAPQTIYRWLYENVQFREWYARARESQAHIFSDEIIDISNDSKNDYFVDDKGTIRVDHENIQRSKLRIDTLKFLMEKHAAKVYGAKIQLNETNDEETAANKKELATLRAKLDAEYRREY